MSISNQRWVLFNRNEVDSYVNMLMSGDNTIKLLALEMLANTEKRFHKKDSARIMAAMQWGEQSLLRVNQEAPSWATMTIQTPTGMQTITYNTADPWSYGTVVSRQADKKKYPDQMYAYDLMDKVRFMHRHGFGKTENDLNKYKKREYKRSAKNHYS